jgi:hypothetical protein
MINMNPNLSYTDRTVHIQRPDVAVLDECIKVANLMENHNLYSTITDLIQKNYKSPKQDLTRIWHSECGLYITISIIHNGYYPKFYTTVCNCAIFPLLCTF